MSTAYFLIADTKLNRTEFRYKYILENYKGVFGVDEGIKFDDDLWESEQEALGDIGRRLFRYAIRPDVELAFYKRQKEFICDSYYDCAKKQILWLKSMIKKHLKNSNEVFIIRLTLGHKTKFGRIVTECIEIDNFHIPDNEFEFAPLVLYKFVDNKRRNLVQ